jgi:hypothetical protein
MSLRLGNLGGKAYVLLLKVVHGLLAMRALS